jgi:hypothetical protein
MLWEQLQMEQVSLKVITRCISIQNYDLRNNKYVILADDGSAKGAIVTDPVR